MARKILRTITKVEGRITDVKEVSIYHRRDKTIPYAGVRYVLQCAMDDAEAGADVVLSGSVGPKAAAVCEKAGIIMVNDASGTVAQAVRSYLDRKQDSAAAKQAPVEKKAAMTSGRGQGGQGRGCGGAGRGMGRGGGGGRGQCQGQAQGR